MRTRFLLSGVLLCFSGAGIIIYQIAETCEDAALTNTYAGYPWCSDVLSHINLTFAGVIALVAGFIVLALGYLLRSSAPPAAGPSASQPVGGRDDSYRGFGSRTSPSSAQSVSPGL